MYKIDLLLPIHQKVQVDIKKNMEQSIVSKKSHSTINQVQSLDNQIGTLVPNSNPYILTIMN